MKKILALVLATLMIATVFTACGDTAAPDAAGDAPASEAGAYVCSASPRCNKLLLLTRTLVKNRGPRPFYLGFRLSRRYVWREGS